MNDGVWRQSCAFLHVHIRVCVLRLTRGKSVDERVYAWPCIRAPVKNHNFRCLSFPFPLLSLSFFLCFPVACLTCNYRVTPRMLCYHYRINFRTILPCLANVNLSIVFRRIPLPPLLLFHTRALTTPMLCGKFRVFPYFSLLRVPFGQNGREQRTDANNRRSLLMERSNLRSEAFDPECTLH